jgi:outer membrane protein assembly factor BamD
MAVFYLDSLPQSYIIRLNYSDLRVGVMKSTLAVLSLLMWLPAAGCSLPSMPSFSWSSSEPKVDATAEALFQDGMKYFKEKRYARALDHFTKLRSEHPFSPQLTLAELHIADAYYLNQQYPEAINAFKEFEMMHPSNENMPFVIYRLGLSYFDQFTSVDRDQKNTEIAKTYFETVIAKYPKSPHAAEAKDKLAKCNGYLAEHDFNVAHFYLQQEKYPAARDRFEEIVRKYRGTPAAAKSLFFLGESYRNEKNNVKAALAYEALLQHYPDSQFASQARTQLARVEKEKHDPLALLLMRDRRPTVAVAQQQSEVKTAGAKPKQPENLVAKTEVVYEEPGAEKGIFRRVVEKINPFASSDDAKKAAEKKNSDSALELLAKKKAAERQESPGMMAGLWRSINPFGGSESPDQKKPDASGSGTLVDRVDDSLKAKGIDSKSQTAALRPPRADLPKVEEPAAVQTTNTSHLLGTIDATLKEGGRNVGELPPTPAAAEAFKQPAGQALAAKGGAKAEAAQPIATTGLLGAIDQKLKSQGVDPSAIELPAPAVEAPQKPASSRPPASVELEPKIATEKGSLFLPPSEVQTQDKTDATGQENKSADAADDQQTAGREIPKALVKGPPQTATTPAAGKPAPQRATPRFGDEEDQGAFDRMMKDAENLGNLLNPFRW